MEFPYLSKSFAPFTKSPFVKLRVNSPTLSPWSPFVALEFSSLLSMIVGKTNPKDTLSWPSAVFFVSSIVSTFFTSIVVPSTTGFTWILICPFVKSPSVSLTIYLKFGKVPSPLASYLL